MEYVVYLKDSDGINHYYLTTGGHYPEKGDIINVSRSGSLSKRINWTAIVNKVHKDTMPIVYCTAIHVHHYHVED